MKKKILFIVGIMMTVAMLTIPVMGAPIKIEVTATSFVTNVSLGKLWVANSNGQFREVVNAVTYTINIPGQAPLVGTGSSVGHSMIKFTQPTIPDPNAWSNDHFKTVIEFTGEGRTGTFEGVGHRKALGFPVSTYEEVYQVLHGTGDFEGQTLKLWGTGAPGIREGVLLMPK